LSILFLKASGMKNNLLIIAAFAVLGAGSLVSCSKNLNREPPNTETASEVFSTPQGALEALAKVYGAYALTGNQGNASSDLGGIDAGTSDFIRLLWYADELPTDEAVCAWNDPGVPDFHNMAWTSSNVNLDGLYYRCMFQITVANAFIQQAASVKFTGSDETDLANYVAEARFLRAFQYWEMMDLFGSPPFITDKDPIGGTYVPQQISRANLFSYVESELLDLDSTHAMVPARMNPYGRADAACVWALLARLYLNADVYLGTGNDHYTQAITYASKVIDSGGYSLDPVYQNLFLADNNVNNPEQILSIEYDAVNSQNYGGTTFIINGEIGGNMAPASYGVPGGGWAGNRVTSNIPALFTTTGDKRGTLFFTSGQTEAIQNVGIFNDGYPAIKFSNLTSTGATPTGASTFCNTDFPLFRLAEQYLIYAEAVLRGGSGGTQALALQYYNDVRTRANAGIAGSISLQDILNERGRELLWECFRRTDLIRYGLFTSQSYLWPWKGGVSSGTGVNPDYNLFPIPAGDLTANPNLKQNPGF
jgi:hypothetical protein